jgi:hypothetical protein
VNARDVIREARDPARMVRQFEITLPTGRVLHPLNVREPELWGLGSPGQGQAAGQIGKAVVVPCAPLPRALRATGAAHRFPAAAPAFRGPAPRPPARRSWPSAGRGSATREIGCPGLPSPYDHEAGLMWSPVISSLCVPLIHRL